MWGVVGARYFFRLHLRLPYYYILYYVYCATLEGSTAATLWDPPAAGATQRAFLAEALLCGRPMSTRGEKHAVLFLPFQTASGHTSTVMAVLLLLVLGCCCTTKERGQGSGLSWSDAGDVGFYLGVVLAMPRVPFAPR